MDLQDLVFAVLNIECAVTQSFTVPPSWKKKIFFVALCVGSMYFVFY